MLIGAMNNPARELFSEMRWMAEAKLDFIDLNGAACRPHRGRSMLAAVKEALEKYSLGVVGHTAFYLPFSCTFDSIRKAAVEETRRCIELFAKIGAKWMNLHPDRHAPFHARPFVIEQNLKSIRELLPVARDNGIGLMIENTPGDFNNRQQLGELLDPVPELGLHLDIGHCNLQVLRTRRSISSWPTVAGSGMSTFTITKADTRTCICRWSGQSGTGAAVACVTVLGLRRNGDA